MCRSAPPSRRTRTRQGLRELDADHVLGGALRGKARQGYERSDLSNHEVVVDGFCNKLKLRVEYFDLL